jgi:DnaJ-class molecular chaperone
MPNYYEILGVVNTVNDTELKKAYRTLSLIHHPDRGGDTLKFQEINEAYETLSDPHRRKQYDAELNGIRIPSFPGFPFPGGTNIHFAHMGGGGGGQPDFGDFNGFINMMFNNAGMPNMNIGKPVPIIRNVKITMEQAYIGVSIPIEIERWVMQDVNTRQTEKETVYVPFPPGIDENEIIVLREKGNVINENTKGDIKIVVQIENNTQFQRHGLDIIYNKKITLKEALCGFMFSIVHLNGKQITFNNTVNNTIIKPNSKKIIPNMGMNRDTNTGNLIIDFEIHFPDTLTPEQITSLSTIL